MLLGEDVKIRAGEKRIYYGGGTSPIWGGSEEGHRRVRHDTRTQHIEKTSVFAHADTKHISVLP